MVILREKKVKVLKKQLWNRLLSCGHWRPTDIAFSLGDFSKPHINSHAFCRRCFKEVKIVKVNEINGELKK